MGTRDSPRRWLVRSTGAPGAGGPPGVAETLRRWMYLPYCLLTSAVAVTLFLQAVLAGQFLSGTFGSLQRHQDGAALADMLLITAFLVAIPARWPGRGPRWPLVASLGLLGLTGAQNVAGFERLLTVHIPLGVAIILLAVLLAVRSWRLVPHAPSPPKTAVPSELARAAPAPHTPDDRTPDDRTPPRSPA
ncbi:hypothetical protein FHR81_002218 [Actinoalloteichus hoggarensis]|uniref:Uncharacterized protein n=1 Tax=Actinoalloteichus hoggarensis TaxID=1470176 RepID=A0A221W5X5_9PSEU|nr:hypothetical protein [Actinoalloteichus hoggarensis]ASO21248.1 hypothetical protein AHOG_18115 [Actinoalloteichus hoggarensis]MBB5921180.1 hypothetical protein [Actinoalloteichus hoggarensis]